MFNNFTLVHYFTPCRFGHLFTDFAMNWNLVARNTQEFLTQCVPAEPNHLVTVLGFDVEMLSLVGNPTFFQLGFPFKISKGNAYQSMNYNFICY